MKERTIDDYMYITFLITCILLTFLIIIYKNFFKWVIIPPCFFWEHLGIYCPACGCTRAFEALLHFDILASIYYNPGVLYFVFFVTIYLITQTIDKISKRPTHCMPYSNAYIYIGVALLIVNCIVRNILLFAFHITL